MNETLPFLQLSAILSRRPDAYASITGSPDYAKVHGFVRFYETPHGVIVSAQIHGLPQPSEPCGNQFFGFHIHEGTTCSGNSDDPFAGASSHFNPTDCPHPSHAGDLPPLLGNQGFAAQVFLTDRFHIRDIVGKALIVHGQPDDFTTQPAGNAGTKIACGIIQRARSH